MKIYILSTGRTGTNFLYNIFHKYYPELHITHQEKYSRIINIISNSAIKEELKYNLLKSIYQNLKKQNTPKSTIDPLQSMCIAKILKYKQIYPTKYKIVHLVRDPRTFVTSFMNWKNSSLKKMFLHYTIPFWMPGPRFNKKLSLVEKITLNKFKQFCWVWYIKNSFFYDVFHKQINYKIVKIEDLTKGDKKEESFNELFEFLNLDVKNFGYDELSNKKINISSKKSFPKYEEWPDNYTNYLINTSGSLMEKLGYN